MSDLRLGLGEYFPENPKGSLTLHDLGELIRRAGRAAGFIVRSEFKVDCRAKNKPKIDWIWFDAEIRPIVAFEIEGRDVARESLKADFEKFAHCAARINVLALFQVDHNHSPKGKKSSAPREWVKECFDEWRKEFPIESEKLGRIAPTVFLDDDLMSDGGIEQLQRLAKEAHAKAAP